MHTQRCYSKRELSGQLRVEYLFSIHELVGITCLLRGGRFSAPS